MINLSDGLIENRFFLIYDYNITATGDESDDEITLSTIEIDQSPDVFNIKNDELIFDTKGHPGSLKVYDITGAIIYQKNVSTESSRLNIGEIQNGLFIFVLSNKHGSKSKLMQIN